MTKLRHRIKNHFYQRRERAEKQSICKLKEQPVLQKYKSRIRARLWAAEEVQHTAIDDWTLAKQIILKSAADILPVENLWKKSNWFRVQGGNK